MLLSVLENQVQARCGCAWVQIWAKVGSSLDEAWSEP